MTNRKAPREAWVRLVENLNPTIAITLGGGLSARPEVLNRAAKEFCCRVERRVLGAQWATKPAADRMYAIGFHEHPNSNRHMHMAVRCPPKHEDVLMTEGNSLWRDARASGDFYCEPIVNVAAYARYITKDVDLPPFGPAVIMGVRRLHS